MSALSERLADVDDRLAKALVRARRQTRHLGVRGAAVAAVLGEEIRRHLIACAGFEEGCEVRDTCNRVSREVDLVFLNRFHPAFLHDDSPKLVYIEGVLAAAEVKTSLSGEGLADCLDKARCFKQLQAGIDPRLDLESHTLDNEDWDYFLWRRPFFAFAFDDRRDLPKIRDNIASWTEENRVPENEQIDAVFVLGKGGILNLRSGFGGDRSPGGAGHRQWGMLEQGQAPVFAQLMTWLTRACPDFSALSPILLRYASFDPSAYRR